MDIFPFEVHVLVDGQKVKEYQKDSKIFIEGKQGKEYSIRIKNNSYGKALAVITVDGLSVLDGKPGSFKSRGYIVDPYSSITIDGWRESTESVRKFFFTDPSNSYASGVEASGNEGVIGVAVFKELDHLSKAIYGFKYTITSTQFPPNTWWLWNSYNRDNYINSESSYSSGTSDPVVRNTIGSCCFRTASSSLDNASSSKKFDLGTGYGEEKKSAITKVDFEREEKPYCVFSINYATRDALKEMGVLDCIKIEKDPDAFPAEFCKPPKR